MKMQMIPPILNDTGDCCCQNCPQCNNCGCVPGGDGCICQGDKSGNSIESAITCDLIWKERQLNGKYKYYKVVSGSSQQNMPVVLPTASLTKRGVVQLTNELSDREDIALTPKGAKDFKTQLDKETADRINADNNFQSQLDKEKKDRANADTDLLNKINQEKDNRANADTDLLNKINQEKDDRAKADTSLSKCINQEINNRKTADNDLSNRITSAVSKANNSVTSVTSNGDATVTVTKADGTSKSFTINNITHASSADSAINATHATNADTATKATNADHATVADRLASGSELDTSALIYKKYNISYRGLASVNYELAHKEQLTGGSTSQYKWTYDYVIHLKCPLNKTFGGASDLIYVSDDVGGLTEYKSRGCVLNDDKSSVTVTMRNKSVYTYTGSNENPPSLSNVIVNYNGVVAIRDVQIKIID